MMNLHKILSLFLISLLISCNNNNNKAEIERVDSLKNELASIENIILKIDSNKISQVYSEYLDNIKTIKANFSEKDDEYIWNAITQYGYIRKPLRNYFRRIPDIKIELEYSLKKLDTLKRDIRKNNISKDDFNKYFDDERINTATLKNFTELTINQALVEMHKFDSLNPVIVDVIEKLKATKQK